MVLEEEEPPPPLMPLAELRQHLQKLKSAREALSDERGQAALFVQEASVPDADDTAKLKGRLDHLLATLQAKKHAAPSPPIPRHGTTPELKKIDNRPGPSAKPEPKGTLDKPLPPAPSPPMPNPTVPETASNAGAALDSGKLDMSKAVDPLALAQALFRLGNYAGALQAYRALPLEGLKAEERAPVQYMIATCLRKSGQVDESTTLYREVANSRGDEHLAACAQWQLQLMRWHKDSTDQLKRLRERRDVLEKEP
jgi:hypothetical protein